MILLDTNIIIEIFDRKSDSGEKLLKRIAESGEQFATTSINIHEVMYGLIKYAKPVKELSMLPILSFTGNDARLSAELELKVEKKGQKIKRMDSMIAAIAINNGARLYTLDKADFPKLREYGLTIYE